MPHARRCGAAVEIRDAEFIRDLAQRQAAAGADLLDVNGGVPGREAESLEWLINVVQEATELPLSSTVRMPTQCGARCRCANSGRW
jgi:cobalamin-dependent methionine synthase I